MMAVVMRGAMMMVGTVVMVVMFMVGVMVVPMGMVRMVMSVRMVRMVMSVRMVAVMVMVKSELFRGVGVCDRVSIIGLYIYKLNFIIWVFDVFILMLN